MKKTILLLLVIMSVFVSCRIDDTPAHQRDLATQKLLKKHKIKIALTGQWASQSGNFILKGAELAKDQINEAGGVLGAQIELVKFDDNNKVSTGSEIAGKISEDQQICAVLGHYSSSVTLFNSVIYHYYGVLMLTPFSTNTTITQQGLPFIFRNIPGNDSFSKEAVDFCDRKNWKRVMALYQDNAYCSELVDSFEQYCGDHTIIVPDRLGYEDFYNLGNYMEIIQRWKNNYTFDAIFIAGFLPQAAEIVSLFRSEGVKTPFIGSVDFDSSSFFSTVGNEAEDNFYCVSIYDPDSKNEAFQKFKEAYVSRYESVPNWEATQIYDALKVLAKAIEKAGTVKHEALAEALKSEEWNEGAGPYRFNENGESERNLIVKKSSAGVFKVMEE